MGVHGEVIEARRKATEVEPAPPPATRRVSTVRRVPAASPPAIDADPGRLPTAAGAQGVTRIRRSAVIRRSPAAFKDERTRLERNPRTKPNAFTNFFGLDEWGKVLDAVDAYAAIPDAEFQARRAGLGSLRAKVATWRGEHAEKVRAKKSDADDDARDLEATPTGVLGSKIAAEQGELGALLGTLAVPSSAPKSTLADPAFTKRQNASGTLNKDVIPSFDVKLTKSSGLSVPGGTACTIIGQYPADGSMMIKVETPQQGAMVAWVPLRDVTVSAAAKIEPAIPFGGPKPTIPAPPSEVVTTGLAYKTLAANTPLFPNPPKIEDIQQGGLGDCYLFAALLSIVARNPNDIVSMMSDEGLTVTVRFYDVKPGTTKTFTPKYARVNKSEVEGTYAHRQHGATVNTWKNAAYARGALWPKMIEKAYAAAGMSGLGTALIGAPSYGEIATGFTAQAMEHLLGQEATMSVEALQTGVGVNAALLPTGVIRLPWSKAESDAYDLAKKATEDKEQAYGGLVSWEIFHDISAVDTWMAFVARVDIEAKVRERKQRGTAYRKAEIRLDDFAGLFKDEGLGDGAAKAVTDWLAAKRLYPGKRGTGKYTANQLALFGRIRTLLNSGGYAAVGSRAEAGRTVGGTGHSGGESKTKGIAGGHAYAVLGFTPDKDPADLLPGELVMVRLRNPWGSYGRQYEPLAGGSLKVKKAPPTGVAATDIAETEKIHQATPGGDFDLELSDLTKRFAWLDSSGPKR